MLPTPCSDLRPKTPEYERLPLDGSWGLVRPSSNKPELVVVAESPTSEETMQAVLKAVELELSGYPEVGGLA